METLKTAAVILAILVLWILLQRFILPKLGIST